MPFAEELKSRKYFCPISNNFIFLNSNGLSPQLLQSILCGKFLDFLPQQTIADLLKFFCFNACHQIYTWNAILSLHDEYMTTAFPASFPIQLLKLVCITLPWQLCRWGFVASWQWRPWAPLMLCLGDLCAKRICWFVEREAILGSQGKEIWKK